MLCLKYLLPLIAVAAAYPTHQKHVDDLTACYETAKNELETCLVEFWNDVKPALVAGIPDLKIVPLDPIHIDEMELNDDGSVVQTKSKYSNVDIIGAGEYEAIAAHIDKSKSEVTVELTIPALFSSGCYEIEGIIMLLPVNGKGKFHLNLTEITGTITSHVVPHGTGVKIDKIKVDFEVGGMKLNLQGQKDKDGKVEEVEQAIIDMVNSNSQAILEDVKPKMSERISQLMMQIADKAMVKLPIKAFME